MGKVVNYIVNVSFRSGREANASVSEVNCQGANLNYKNFKNIPTHLIL